MDRTRPELPPTERFDAEPPFTLNQAVIRGRVVSLSFVVWFVDIVLIAGRRDRRQRNSKEHRQHRDHGRPVKLLVGGQSSCLRLGQYEFRYPATQKSSGTQGTEHDQHLADSTRGGVGAGRAAIGPFSVPIAISDGMSDLT
jgi:hypothetical protein